MDLIYSLGNEILHGAPLMIKVDLKRNTRGYKRKLNEIIPTWNIIVHMR